MNAGTDNIIYSVFLLCSAVGLTNIPLKQDALDVWIRTQTFFLNVLLGKQNLFIFLYGLTNSIHAILVTTTVSMNKLWELLQRV